MKQFRKNVLRLALRNRSAMLGAILIIGIGIFVYVAMMDTLHNLDDQIRTYYEENDMADVFAEVSGISPEDLERMTEIPGIRAAGGRMSADLRILADGQETIVSVHLLSWDPADTINRIALSEPWQGEDDIYLGIRMAEHYKYPEGTAVRLLHNGDSMPFTLRGTCRAPDYIYSIPPGGAMVPDGEVYDMAVISRERMESLLGVRNSLSELGFLLEEGYSFEDVRHQLTERLAPYGLRSLVKREDQASANMVTGEMTELISTGTILPILFMLISVFMLYVVLRKMIDRDRTLIGTMKAFGMSSRELMSAYLVEGLAIGAAGALLGSLTAGALGRFMFDLYVDFFSLPDPVYHDMAGTRVTGLVISLAVSVLAVLIGVREILHITPAAAMRQPEPETGRTLRLPQWLVRRSSVQFRIGLRSAARYPLRSLLVVLAVIFAFSLSSSLFCFMPMFNALLRGQFEEIQAYDLQLTLDRPVRPGAAADAAVGLQDVTLAEGVCQTPVMIRRDNRTEYSVLYGLGQDSRLYRIRDNERGILKPPKGEVILNRRTAGKLNVQPGEYIEMQAPELSGRFVRVRVADVMSELIGINCYMELESFRDVFDSGAVVNTVLLQAPEEKLAELSRSLKETSRVAWIVDTRKIVKAYRDMIDSMVYMVDMFGLLSVAAGAILIYNISMINLKDRYTELGTLRVLGMDFREIGQMLLMEKMICFVPGILLGIPGSWGVNRLLEVLIISDTFDIRLHIGPDIYAVTCGICLVMVLAAWYAEQKLVRTIDLTDTLRARE